MVISSLKAFGASDDFGAQAVAVAAARGAPAAESETFAGAETLGERADRARHRAIEGEIVLKIDFVSGDDSGALGVVAVIAKDMWIAEDRVCTVDIDDGFSGAWKKASTALGDDPDVIGKG